MLLQAAEWGRGAAVLLQHGGRLRAGGMPCWSLFPTRPPARLLSLPCLLPSLLQSAAMARAAAFHKGIRTKKSKAAAAAASQ